MEPDTEIKGVSKFYSEAAALKEILKKSDDTTALTFIQGLEQRVNSLISSSESPTAKSSAEEAINGLANILNKVQVLQYEGFISKNARESLINFSTNLLELDLHRIKEYVSLTESLLAKEYQRLSDLKIISQDSMIKHLSNISFHTCRISSPDIRMIVSEYLTQYAYTKAMSPQIESALEFMRKSIHIDKSLEQYVLTKMHTYKERIANFPSMFQLLVSTLNHQRECVDFSKPASIGHVISIDTVVNTQFLKEIEMHSVDGIVPAKLGSRVMHAIAFCEKLNTLLYSAYSHVDDKDKQAFMRLLDSKRIYELIDLFRKQISRGDATIEGIILDSSGISSVDSFKDYLETAKSYTSSGRARARSTASAKGGKDTKISLLMCSYPGFRTAVDARAKQIDMYVADKISDSIREKALLQHNNEMIQVYSTNFKSFSEQEVEFLERIIGEFAIDMLKTYFDATKSSIKDNPKSEQAYINSALTQHIKFIEFLISQYSRKSPSRTVFEREEFKNLAWDKEFRQCVKEVMLSDYAKGRIYPLLEHMIQDFDDAQVKHWYCRVLKFFLPSITAVKHAADEIKYSVFTMQNHVTALENMKRIISRNDAIEAIKKSDLLTPELAESVEHSLLLAAAAAHSQNYLKTPKAGLFEIDSLVMDSLRPAFLCKLKSMSLEGSKLVKYVSETYQSLLNNLYFLRDHVHETIPHCIKAFNGMLELPEFRNLLSVIYEKGSVCREKANFRDLIAQIIRSEKNIESSLNQAQQDVKCLKPGSAVSLSSLLINEVKQIQHRNLENAISELILNLDIYKDPCFGISDIVPTYKILEAVAPQFYKEDEKLKISATVKAYLADKANTIMKTEFYARNKNKQYFANIILNVMAGVRALYLEKRRSWESIFQDIISCDKLATEITEKKYKESEALLLNIGAETHREIFELLLFSLYKTGSRAAKTEFSEKYSANADFKEIVSKIHNAILPIQKEKIIFNISELSSVLAGIMNATSTKEGIVEEKESIASAETYLADVNKILQNYAPDKKDGLDTRRCYLEFAALLPLRTVRLDKKIQEIVQAYYPAALSTEKIGGEELSSRVKFINDKIDALLNQPAACVQEIYKDTEQLNSVIDATISETKSLIPTQAYRFIRTLINIADWRNELKNEDAYKPLFEVCISYAKNIRAGPDSSEELFNSVYSNYKKILGALKELSSISEKQSTAREIRSMYFEIDKMYADTGMTAANYFEKLAELLAASPGGTKKIKLAIGVAKKLILIKDKTLSKILDSLTNLEYSPGETFFDNLSNIEDASYLKERLDKIVQFLETARKERGADNRVVFFGTNALEKITEATAIYQKQISAEEFKSIDSSLYELLLKYSKISDSSGQAEKDFETYTNILQLGQAEKAFETYTNILDLMCRELSTLSPEQRTTVLKPYNSLLKKIHEEIDKDRDKKSKRMQGTSIQKKQKEEILNKTDLADKIKEEVNKLPDSLRTYMSAAKVLLRRKDNATQIIESSLGSLGGGPDGFAKYFEDATKDIVFSDSALIANLVNIRQLLRNLSIADTGRAIKIVEDKKLTGLCGRVEEDTIYLPPSISIMGSAEENYSLYKILCAKLACKIRYGSFNLFEDEFVLEHAKAAEEQKKITLQDVFPVEKSYLFEILYYMLDDLRVDSLIVKDYRGLSKRIPEFNKLRQDELEKSAMSNNIPHELILFGIYKKSKDPAASNRDILDKIGYSLFDKAVAEKNISAVLDIMSDASIETKNVNDLLKIAFDAYQKIKSYFPAMPTPFTEDIERILKPVEPEKQVVLKNVPQEETFVDKAAVQREIGGRPVFKYDEWNSELGTYMPRYCTVIEPEIREKDYKEFSITDLDRSIIGLLKMEIERLKPTGLVLQRKQDEGEIDLTEFNEQIINLRLGRPFSERVFIKPIIKKRSVSTALMLDISGSLADSISGHEDEFIPQISIAKKALVYILEATKDLGDRIAAFAYRSDSREKIEVFLLKDFGELYGPEVKKRIGSLIPNYCNRDGAAIRHITSKIYNERAKTKIIIPINDALPADSRTSADEPCYDCEYAQEDTRRAVLEARHAGINVYGLVIDPENSEHAQEIYGPGNFTTLSRIPELPTKLVQFYTRLTK